MIGWLKRKIAWAVAGAELEELERWRVVCSEEERWFSEFPEVVVALDHLKRCARGVENPEFISTVRDVMRRRRDSRPGPFSTSLRDLVPAGWPSHAELDRLAAIPVMSDAEREQFRVRRRSALNPPSCSEQYRAQLEAATDWDVAEQLAQAAERLAFVSPPAPTHFDGLVPRS